MGVDSRRPPLPADTDTSTGTGTAEGTATDLVTDLSRHTDRTHYSIPDDGSPVTIATRHKKSSGERESAKHRGSGHGEGLSRHDHRSQTSLLIEYFEGGKTGENQLSSRPSVRVKVTPSTARRLKETSDHIQITETHGERSRHPSRTQRISLSPGPRREGQTRGGTLGDIGGDERSISSYASATEESNLAPRRGEAGEPPVEVEVMRKDTASPLLPSNSPRDTRYIQPNPSEISSMPPESLMEPRVAEIPQTPTKSRSRSISREEIEQTADTLKTPSRRRSRSLSKERLTQKVIEKLSGQPVDVSVSPPSKHRHRSSGGSRSASKEHRGHHEASKSSRRRSSKSHRDEDITTSGAESSMLTNSELSGSRRSDHYSTRSSASGSSVNPKLLATVEDMVRRLIVPELTAIRHEQQRRHSVKSTSSRNARESNLSGSSVSQEDISRRVSKTSSAPEFIEKRRSSSKLDEKESRDGLKKESPHTKKHRKGSREMTDSPRRRSERRVSEEGASAESTPKKKHSKHRDDLQDAAAVGLAGALAAAALHHHDSTSSLDQKDAERRDRRKRRSKSRSRSASISESLESPSKDIPPMPLSSDINGSELTRTSILSELSEYADSTITPSRHTPTRELISPAQTPTRSPATAKRGLGMHHSNLSQGDLNTQSTPSYNKQQAERAPLGQVQSGLTSASISDPAVIPAPAPQVFDSGSRAYDAFQEHLWATGRKRGLSPIQSVASYQEESMLEHSRRHSQSTASLSSLGNKQKQQYRSGASVESAPASPALDRSRNVRLEDDEDEQGGYPKEADLNFWEQQHEENERNRSFNERLQRDPQAANDLKRLTNYTDDSSEAERAYFDKVASGQQVVDVGAIPEYRHTPVAASSAVASLQDPSVLDFGSDRSRADDRSYAGDSVVDDPYDMRYSQQYATSQRSLPLSQTSSPRKPYASRSYQDQAAHDIPRSQEASLNSSPQKQLSRASSAGVDKPKMSASGIPDINDPLPEVGHVHDDESDMTTNPSIIQGPIGGIHHDNRDHWPYEPTPPQATRDILSGEHTPDHKGVGPTEAGLLGAAAGMGLGAILGGDKYGDEEDFDKVRSPKASTGKHVHLEDQYDEELKKDIASPREREPENMQSSFMKDEGYISAPNARSSDALTPEPRNRGLSQSKRRGIVGTEDPIPDDEDDVFADKNHARNFSGASHGIASPLYDSAMGRGLDKIQSKDVVALMDLLTVRDAQRNARDTEILVTLVRSAAEMRNSFEDMKKLLAEQEKYIVDSTDRNTERTVHKAMHGPRPQPFGPTRGTRRSSTDDEAIDDLPTKRQNVFKRALKGLSMRSTHDLANIENMLTQLLGDVETLKSGQEGSRGEPAPSLDSYDNLRTVPEGYEPEGQAGTGSTNQSGSGFFSNSSRQTSARRGMEGRRASENRISTVEEGDEDLAAAEDEAQRALQQQETTPINEGLLTPTHRQFRGSSAPAETPVQTQQLEPARSAETPPRSGKDRKHKSTASSIIPKISRWSETTASSVAKNFRRKERDSYLDAASRSGSEGEFWNDDMVDPQGADRLHSGFSSEALRPREDEPYDALTPQPQSRTPVAEDGAAEYEEDPKYQAHRNSLNLQHPQPRAGHKYQHQLESSAQNYDPISPTSEQWGSSTNLNRYSGASNGTNNRYSGNGNGTATATAALPVSPLSEGGQSYRSASHQGPPRPPKIPEEPLSPQRPPKIRSVDGQPQYVEQPGSNNRLHPNQQQLGSPRSVSSGQQFSRRDVPQRKPTGPRPLSSAGDHSPGSAARRRNRDTFGGSQTAPANDEEDVTF